LNKIFQPKFLPLVATTAGLMGFMLRFKTISGGTDAEGLYTFELVPWLLLCIVSIAVPVLIFVMARPLTEPGKFSDNFPVSIVSAVGCLIGALGLAISALDMFQIYQRSVNTLTPDTLSLIAAVLGLMATVMIGVVAFARLKGNKPNFLCHLSVCLYMAVRIFCQCRAWSNEPQISVFLLPFLANLFVMLAAYHLCAFDVDMGKRRASLMYSLCAVYLCLTALPGAQDILFLGCMAIWLLTNLCSLRIIKSRKSKTPVNPVQATMGNSDVSIDELQGWLEEEE